MDSDIDEKREVVVFARDRATEGVARDQRDPKVPIGGHLLDDDLPNNKNTNCDWKHYEKHHDKTHGDGT